MWTVNWVAYIAQSEWDAFDQSYQLYLKYFVARFAPFYSYFGWSPTWESWELSNEDARIEKWAKFINEISPWNKFPTCHDRAKTVWSDWQLVQFRQCQSRTVAAGNSRSCDGYSGYANVIVGVEDSWEYCGGGYGQPTNGTEVRRGIWGQLLAGVYTEYSEWQHGGSAKGPCAGNAKGEGDKFNKIAMDFWYDRTTWYKYSMKNNLVADQASSRCNGWDGKEYFIYDENGGSNSINLSNVQGTFKVTWLDPVTGNLFSGSDIQGGGIAALNPPSAISSEWGVLISNASPTPSNTPVKQTRIKKSLSKGSGKYFRIDGVMVRLNAKLKQGIYIVGIFYFVHKQIKKRTRNTDFGINYGA